MNLLTYLFATEVTDRLLHPSSDYKWRDEMQKKIREQKEEIRRMEAEMHNRNPKKSEWFLADAAKWKEMNQTN